MLPLSLKGKRILITGASSGIGRACAICASRIGARIVLTARRLSALEETMELAGKGVRVNAVCPSHVRTPLYDAGACNLNDESALHELLKKQPPGLGEPEDVGFLLSEALRFMTGAELPVDGGYLAQ